MHKITVLQMIGSGDKTRTQQEVARLFHEEFPNLTPISQGTIKKLEKQFREFGHVGQIKKVAANECLLQCVYRKMNAVNEEGFPTVDGLVSLYTDGISQKDYILATMQAVNHCVNHAQKKHLITSQSISEHGKTCDIAYDVFDCVSDEIGKYCGQTL